MFIGKIDYTTSKQSFNGCFVTLAEKNLGKETAKNVVEVFNKKIFPQLSPEISPLSDTTNFFALAAGAGTRFKISHLVGDYNKVNMPLTPETETVHMLDFLLALAKPFMNKKGAVPLMQHSSNGSFGGVVDYYLSGKPVKDTIVCSADSIFGSDSKNLIEFFKKSISDKKVHLAVIGGQRTPQEVVGRYGVLDLKKADENYLLKKFVEKPELPIAQKYAENGQDAVNTGFYYISKDAMINLLNEIKSGNNPIKRNDTEIYDFGLTIKYVHSQYQKWFGKKAAQCVSVKLSPSWEDVGEAQGFYSLMKKLKQGEYLHNFPQGLSEKVQNDLSQRVHLDSHIPYINFSPNSRVSLAQIKNAQTIDGVKIIV